MSAWEGNEQICLHVLVSHNINAACSGLEAYEDNKNENMLQKNHINVQNCLL